MRKLKLKINNKGVIAIWALVLGAIFLIMLSGVVSFLVFQIQRNQKALDDNIAFHIASSGVEFAKWHLAHNPDDFDFSGTYDYKDPEGDVVGSYQLTITPPNGCDASVKLTSIGFVNGSNEHRQIDVVYAKPSVASYSMLSNSPIWFGPDEEIKGMVHSNTGIRMDGEQNSLATCYQENYVCDANSGCAFSADRCPGCEWHCTQWFWWFCLNGYCDCPGIWGSGSGQSKGLWSFPYSNISFDKIISNLSELRDLATSSGVYFGDSGEIGWHFIFKSNGTFDAYKVKQLMSPSQAYDGENWISVSTDIYKETFYQNYSIPSDCSPVFVEDDLWIEGSVNGRVTVVAARFPDIPATNAQIIIPNNITYFNDSSVLGLIAQKNILIPLRAPNNLEISAAMIAQNGHIYRYQYPSYWPYTWIEPYKTYAKRNYLKTFGSICSNKQWNFSYYKDNDWLSGVISSGYQQADMIYDTRLTSNPPPYFPVFGDYFEIVSWNEVL